MRLGKDFTSFSFENLPPYKGSNGEARLWTPSFYTTNWGFFVRARRFNFSHDNLLFIQNQFT